MQLLALEKISISQNLQNISTFIDENALKNRSHHTFLSDKTDINKHSFKMEI